MKKLIIREPNGNRRSVIFSGPKLTIGRDDTNDVVLLDPQVSRRHAAVYMENGGFSIIDQRSSNGTFVDNEKIVGKRFLRGDETIKVADYVISLAVEDADDDTNGFRGSRAKVESKAQENAMKSQTVRVRAAEAPKSARGASRPVKRNEVMPEKRGGGRGVKEKSEKLDLKRENILIDIRREIHGRLLQYMDLRKMDFNKMKDQRLKKDVKSLMDEIILELDNEIPSWVDREILSKNVLDEALGLGPLEDYLADDTVTEIMVNNKDKIYVERHGRLEKVSRRFSSDEAVLSVIERIVGPIGRRIDESSPYVDARLKDGSRVNAIIPPLALTGPTLTIRKFSREPFKVNDLISFGSLTGEMAQFLEACVRARKNVIISGGTGSGKTTLLNVVSSYIPEGERIVTIEDAAELKLPQEHVVSLEARPPNIEGKGAIVIRDLVKNSLRMRPDRIVVGECRGGEALDMLQAMNTGHDGSISTIHANSPIDSLNRLETMVLMSGMELPSRAIREQISAAINIIVQTARYSDGTRKISHISETLGFDELGRIKVVDLFRFYQEGLDEEGGVIGTYSATGIAPTFIDEFRSKGIPFDMEILNKKTDRIKAQVNRS